LCLGDIQVLEKTNSTNEEESMSLVNCEKDITNTEGEIQLSDSSNSLEHNNLISNSKKEDSMASIVDNSELLNEDETTLICMTQVEDMQFDDCDILKIKKECDETLDKEQVWYTL
jgi:hypothetical protein